MLSVVLDDVTQISWTLKILNIKLATYEAQIQFIVLCSTHGVIWMAIFKNFLTFWSCFLQLKTKFGANSLLQVYINIFQSQHVAE